MADPGPLLGLEQPPAARRRAAPGPRRPSGRRCWRRRRPRSPPAPHRARSRRVRSTGWVADLRLSARTSWPARSSAATAGLPGRSRGADDGDPHRAGSGSSCSSSSTGANRSPCSLDPLQHLVGLEAQAVRIAGVEGVGDLVPGERRRGGRPLARPQRVDGDRRLRGRVLAPVDEHLAAAQALGHLRDDQVGLAALERLGDGLGVRLRRLVGRVPVQRHVHLHSLRSGALREAFQSEAGEEFPQQQRDPAALDDRRRRAGVEVEGEDRGPLDVGGQRERGMELERRQLGEPDQRRQVLDEAEVDRAGAPPGPDRTRC